MADEKIKIGLDPKEVLNGMKDISEGVKNLATDIENSLGKKAVDNVDNLKMSVQKGAGEILSILSNMGTRVKEDLKTAFDLASIVEGARFAKGLGEGVKQVFEMERAFDKLNTRLQLTNKQMQAFKTEITKKISATGQTIESVLPGVESAAAKGGIKSPDQLAAIGEMLAQVKTTTGEETGTLADTVVEILKNQGQKITATSFKNTLDALQSTRVQGAFKTAGEAGHAIQDISPFAKQMGLSTRELGGLSATASKAGEAGQEILKQLLESASKMGGATKLNATLGQNIFKTGAQGQAIGMDISKLGKINMQSPQIMETITGLTGASGADLKRFVDSFKGNMDEFSNVIRGTDETSRQFEIAADNLATIIDKYKEGFKRAGLEIGSSISHLGKDVIERKFGDLKDDLTKVGSSLWENKGALLGVAGTAAIAGMLSGGSLNRLLGKLGGGAAGEAVSLTKNIGVGQALKQAGITPVFVVNAAEIGRAAGSSQGVTGAIESMTGAFATTGGIAGGIGMAKTVGGGMGLRGILSLVGTALGVGLAGAGIGFGINALLPKKANDFLATPADALYDMLHPEEKPSTSPNAANSQKTIDPEMLKNAVREGTHEGSVKAQKEIKGSDKTVYTNPSEMNGRGRQM